MAVDLDHYEAYYMDKLWNMMPAIYRTLDTDAYEQNGPLREIVNRIGVQAAILRRSMDRMWEDQSIENCDDWVIPYIADLLATNLVASLDARGQRLDVAKTIYYRRRKGTVAILEEIASDITGWNARIVEFFRHLGRTRHNLDPEIGLPAATDDFHGNQSLQVAEGLVGSSTHTGMGGWADLRKSYGASKTSSAFDEYAYTADFRRGQGKVGWYNIAHLGVFLWRLNSFGLDSTTPVQSVQCPGHYTFDPTGRDIPLFAAAIHAFGDAWVSPQEWQLPTAISTLLLKADLQLPINQQHLYATVDPADSTGSTVLPRSLGISSGENLIPGDQITVDPHVTDTETFLDPLTGLTVTRNIAFFIDPQNGRLIARTHAPIGRVNVTYHYGFSSSIGAGPFDRRVIGTASAVQLESTTSVTGGGDALKSVLAAITPTATVSVNDSLTYTSIQQIHVEQITIMAQNEICPVIRLPMSSPNPAQWIFTGTAGSTLTLEGLFFSGGDIVLQGTFESVTITCCTFDPGDAADVNAIPALYTQAIDGQDLIPCRLLVQAQIGSLSIDRCILGPIRTQDTGEIKSLLMKDSIVQAIRTADVSPFALTELKDPAGMATLLSTGSDPLVLYLKEALTAVTQQLLSSYDSSQLPSQALQQALIKDLNEKVLAGPALYDQSRFAGVQLTATTRAWAAQVWQGDNLERLNRWLLEEAYPAQLASKDSVLTLSNGEAQLTRCTLLGPVYAHRLSASECILDDITLVDDAQHGCVRFSAWATGSAIPRRFESVNIARQSPLFVSRSFGQPGYGQLLFSVDSTILPGQSGATIAQGAENGSEMGAFAREKNPIKERSLLMKYQEFMPLGLTPVIIYAN